MAAIHRIAFRRTGSPRMASPGVLSEAGAELRTEPNVAQRRPRRGEVQDAPSNPSGRAKKKSPRQRAFLASASASFADATIQGLARRLFTLRRVRCDATLERDAD